MKAGDLKAQVQGLLLVKQDRDLGPASRAAFERLAATSNDAEWGPQGTNQEVLLTRKGVRFYRAGQVLSWTGPAPIDVDGAPDAYHQDDHKGRDYLANAGRPGNWWGIVTDTDHIAGHVGKGQPLVQGQAGVPAFSEATRGYYVSCTAFADNPELPITDVRRYCNPDEVPGIVLPGGLPLKVRMGTRCRCTYGTKSMEGIVFDLGGSDSIGEIGTLMAAKVGIPNNPKSGGAPGGVLFEIFL